MVLVPRTDENKGPRVADVRAVLGTRVRKTDGRSRPEDLAATQFLAEDSVIALLDSPRLRRHYREQLSGAHFHGK